MAIENLKNLNLVSLEEIFITTKREIESTKNSIINTLKIEISEDVKNSETFVADVNESIQSLTKNLKNSDLTKDLSHKIKYLALITEELELRRKDLFENFEIEKVPLDKLSKFEAFFANYQTEVYKEKQSQLIHLVKGKTSSLLTMDTEIHDTNLTVRSKNTLRAAEILTIGQLVKLVENNNKRDLLKFRNFGKISYLEIESFLEEHNFLEDSNISNSKINLNTPYSEDTKIEDVDHLSARGRLLLRDRNILILGKLIECFQGKNKEDVMKKNAFSEKYYNEFEAFLQKFKFL